MGQNPVKKKKRKLYHANEAQTWQNDVKEQPYLMPGTAEYEERCEDLMMHDPFRPDDPFHIEAEKVNEDHSLDLLKAHRKQNGFNEGRRKGKLQMSKRVKFPQVKQEAIEQAKKTPETWDDEKAERMMPECMNHMVYNDGITESGYVPRKAARSYLYDD